MSDLEHVEAKLRRKSGADEETKKALKTIHEEYRDWRGYCRKCKRVLEGTLAELRKGCPDCAPVQVKSDG